LLAITLILSTSNIKAQSIAQLITQLELDIQKLSELKTILNDMYASYEIIDKGYTDIKNIARGNYTLHELYLDGLLAISPSVKNYEHIPDIINKEYTIISESNAASRRFNAGGHFSAQELVYIVNTYASLMQQSEKEIDELTMVITADQLRMSDAERMQAIDRVYADITGQLRFLRQFNNTTSMQAIQRLREANDIITLKSIYGIRN
jgi:hypothetical protein